MSVDVSYDQFTKLHKNPQKLVSTEYYCSREKKILATEVEKKFNEREYNAENSISFFLFFFFVYVCDFIWTPQNIDKINHSNESFLIHGITTVAGTYIYIFDGIVY